MLDRGEGDVERVTNTKEGVREDGHGKGQCDENLWTVDRWKNQRNSNA